MAIHPICAALGFQAIGQVRRDTALFGIPVFTGGRGRRRIYGDQYDAEVINALPEIREWLYLYGKWQWVRYRSAVCLARFMKGRKVRAIWMQIEDENGVQSKQRLILSTLSDLMPQQIFVYYGRRWSIEDLFNQMKNRWGWKDAWQQSRQVLHRWTQFLSIAYALPQLLATYCGAQVESLMDLTPWRKKDPTTAGRIRLGM
ncbi:MAG: transposase [Proteobacteria bacterium]|nr:transposase [Pseudomonadota bacterium]MBU4044682.1 transposase [Pseudomonadota bacterium]